MNLFELTVKEAHRSLVGKKFSALELTKSVLERINRVEKKIGAFITITPEIALEQAGNVDELIARGETVGPLAGIPYSAKDVFCTKGIKTTASSKILENFVPPYDAAVIKKLKEQNGVFIGKTNHDAFGFGSSTENSDFGVTKNPWDLKRVPGGSSGGSAAAVISGMGLYSIAEDTGGSIRQPACFCSVVGMKVTYGRVSRYGVLAYGSSLDTQGPIAKTVEDAAIILNYIAGHDPFDATTPEKPVPNYLKGIEKGIKEVKVGVPKEYFVEGLDEEIKDAVKKAIKKIEDLGAKVVSVSLPHTKYATASYYLSGISEVSANLARYDGIRFGYSNPTAKTIAEVYNKSRAVGFGPEVKRRIMLGTYSLSAGYYDAYYKKAQQVRRLIKEDFKKVFNKVDVLVAPVSPILPFEIGEKIADPLQMWLADVLTVTINPAGVPALALPCGFSKEGLPIGMQIIGPQFSEELLFRVGYAYEQATEWHKARPKV